MRDSGKRASLSKDARPKLDKHSTGGVGDKVSICLAPLLAACGARVPMISGRSLGHTGGTLDKLEAIPGFNVSLPIEAFERVVDREGLALIGQTADLAPADRKLYALRDVTGTVECVPLIASSIMSKKIAEGAGALVLDVKVGSGAFMPDLAAGRELAAALVEIGTDHGLRVAALLTDMSTPLGRAVGNAVEVAESVDVLRGGGPADVVELTVALAREMLALAGVDADPAEVLASGRAYETWRAMISAQGGDPDAELPEPKHVHTVTAERDGVIASLDARSVGVAAWRLGAGRARKEDPVQAAAGVLCLAKPGERVSAGDPVLELRTDTPEAVPSALSVLADAYVIADEAPAATPLVIETIRP